MGKPENIFDPVFAYAISLMNSIQWFSLNKVFFCGLLIYLFKNYYSIGHIEVTVERKYILNTYFILWIIFPLLNKTNTANGKYNRNNNFTGYI